MPAACSIAASAGATQRARRARRGSTRAGRRRTSRSAPSAGPAPREAPSTRSSANSFVRCATVTVNVLKIRKPPTSSATPAKTSSAVRMKPSASERSCGLLLGRLLARSAPGSRCPSVFCDRGLDRVRVARRRSRSRSSRSRRGRSSRCASGSVIATSRAPPRLSLPPSVAMPETLYCLAGASAGDGDRVADLEAVLLRRAAVDRDLVGGLRRAALLVVEDLEDLLGRLRDRSASAGRWRRSPRPSCPAACRRS